MPPARILEHGIAVLDASGDWRPMRHDELLVHRCVDGEPAEFTPAEVDALLAESGARDGLWNHDHDRPWCPACQAHATFYVVQVREPHRRGETGRRWGPSARFDQLPRALVQHHRAALGWTAGDLALHVLLETYRGPDGVTQPGLTRLAAQLGATRQHIARQLRDRVAAGLYERHDRRRAHGGAAPSAFTFEGFDVVARRVALNEERRADDPTADPLDGVDALLARLRSVAALPRRRPPKKEPPENEAAAERGVVAWRRPGWSHRCDGGGRLQATRTKGC